MKKNVVKNNAYGYKVGWRHSSYVYNSTIVFCGLLSSIIISYYKFKIKSTFRQA